MGRAVDHTSRPRTGESHLYRSIGADFASHRTVNRGKTDHARGGGTIETAEGVFERDMTGVYHHRGGQSFQRYRDAFTVRFDNRTARGVNDTIRAERMTGAPADRRKPHHLKSP